MESKIRAIDVWANYWTEDFFKSYRPLGEVYEKMGMIGQVTDLDKLAADTQNSGVEKIIISATDVPGNPVGNKKVADAISLFSDFLIGCASINPMSGEDALVELKRSSEFYGFRALKILPFVHGIAPSHGNYNQVYEECIRLGMPVIFLTGHQATMVPSDIGRPNHLDDIALRFPELIMIAGPGGWPWTDELIALAWKHPNLYIHSVVAPPPFRDQYLSSSLIQYANGLGKEKVVWGTGYPFMGHAEPLSEVSETLLEPDVQKAFLWKNASFIWGWN